MKNHIPLLSGCYQKFKLVKGNYFFPFEAYQKRLKCIFIHIPKTAGTSILKALGKNNGGRNHLSWYVYYTARQNYFERFFKFAFVRNPWDRAYSSYKYLRNGGNKQGDIELSNLLSQFDSFDDFVIRGLEKGHFRSHLLFLPQSNFIAGPNGKLMIDFVGRFENIEADFNIIAKKLGLKPILPKENVTISKTKCYKHAYNNSKSINIINEIYKEDIINFDYIFS